MGWLGGAAWELRLGAAASSSLEPCVLMLPMDRSVHPPVANGGGTLLCRTGLAGLAILVSVSIRGGVHAVVGWGADSRPMVFGAPQGLSISI